MDCNVKFDIPFALPPQELRSVVLDLPPPISVNRVRKIDFAKLRLSKRWVQMADALVMAARCRQREPIKKIPGRFEIKIVLCEQRNKLDADNAVKGIIDYLRRIELITNDSKRYMRRVVVEWGHAPEGCRIILTELV